MVAEWTPDKVEGLPEEMIAAGWKTGVPVFFNVVVNYGFIKADDGNTYFIYGNNIVEDDFETPIVKNFGFPVIEPMKGVVFKVGKGQKAGTVQAVNVYQPRAIVD